MAKGLFHKAFEMSGGISLKTNLPPGTLPTLQPASASLTQGQTILEKLLVADGTVADEAAAKVYIGTRSPAQIAEYLRAQEGGALLTKVTAAGQGNVAPIPDGTVLPADPIGAIAADKYVKVPMLAGNTRDEGKLFASLLGTIGFPTSGWIVTDAPRFSMMFNFNPDAAPTLTVNHIIDPFYLPVDKAGTGYNAATALITKGLFEANRDNLLNTMKTRQSNIWHYRLDWSQEAAPWNDVYGASHAFDLPFVFGNFEGSLLSNVMGGKANEKGRVALSKAVMASVGAFMRNGDPNTPELGATWGTWPSQLLLDATPTATKITAAP
ncbi:Para-nitrobenzyl esterase [compost metagenome]